MEHEISLPCSQELVTCLYPEPDEPSELIPSYFPKIHSNVILTSTPRSLPFEFSNQNFVCISYPPPHVLHVPPSHSPRFDHTNNIPWNFSLCSLLQPPATSSLLGLNIPLSALFSKTLNLRSSLSVRDQVSHLYKTRKTIFFNILIIKFWETTWENKICFTEW